MVASPPAADRAAIADAVVKVGALMAAHPQIRELDLNPVLAYTAGAIAVEETAAAAAKALLARYT